VTRGTGKGRNSAQYSARGAKGQPAGSQEKIWEELEKKTPPLDRAPNLRKNSNQMGGGGGEGGGQRKGENPVRAVFQYNNGGKGGKSGTKLWGQKTEIFPAGNLGGARGVLGGSETKKLPRKATWYYKNETKKK